LSGQAMLLVEASFLTPHVHGQPLLRSIGCLI
jgi:hypothetical protein